MEINSSVLTEERKPKYTCPFNFLVIKHASAARRPDARPDGAFSPSSRKDSEGARQRCVHCGKQLQPLEEDEVLSETARSSDSSAAGTPSRTRG